MCMETSAWGCIPWGVCYNRGMNKEVYTVVNGEDNYGISTFKLFEHEADALEYAETLMNRYGSAHFKYNSEPMLGAVANWRAGCDYITVFLKEVE